MGNLTIDVVAGTATGVMGGTGNFGLGSSDWMLWIDGMTRNTVTFTGGETGLLTLDYVLSHQQVTWMREYSILPGAISMAAVWMMARTILTVAGCTCGAITG